MSLDERIEDQPSPEQNTVTEPTSRASSGAASSKRPLYSKSDLASSMDGGPNKSSYAPYFPSDVKQRRRTSRAQVVVLEDAYSRTTKPDGPLRISLAARLDMTPRGVQVWFQNRRAKDKMLRKKAALDLEIHGGDQDSGEPSPLYKEDFTVDPEEAAMFNECPPNLSQPLNPNHSPRLHLELPRYAPPSADMLAMRRGSAPGPPLPGDVPGPIRMSYISDSATGRRGSVDPASAHPYIRRDVGQGPGLYRSNSDAGMAETFSAHSVALPNAWPRMENGKPNLSHRASLPHFEHTQRQQGWTLQRPPPLPLHREMYADGNKSIASPIPGPLPSPTFTFGAVSDIPITPPEGQTTFGYISRPDVDGDDDSASEAYDRFSRFGSLASESSVTSAYLSEKGSIGSESSYPASFMRDAPQPSLGSIAPFVNLMTGMTVDLSLQTTPVSAPLSTSPDHHSNYSSPSSTGGVSALSEAYPLEHSCSGALSHSSIPVPTVKDENTILPFEDGTSQPWSSASEYHEVPSYRTVGLEPHMPQPQLPHFSPAQHFSQNSIYDMSGNANTSPNQVDQSTGETSPLEYNAVNPPQNLTYSQPISFAAQMDAQQLRMSFDQTYNAPSNLGYNY